LSKIGRLTLLSGLFETICIPSAVLQEIRAIDKAEINLSEIDFKPIEITNRVAVLGLLGKLHQGEVEVMIGAIENGISTVVLDENAARNKAKQMGLTVTGTVGILLASQRRGLIDDVLQEVEALKHAGMYLSDKVLKRIQNTLG
jgi:predicted nucleic acid-binding protein